MRKKKWFCFLDYETSKIGVKNMTNTITNTNKITNGDMETAFLFLVENIKDGMQNNGYDGEEIVRELEELKSFYIHRASVTSTPIPLLPKVIDQFINDTKEYYEIGEVA